MAEHNCTQRELIELNFEHVKEALIRIESNQNEIKFEVKKTNGRVTELEALANRQKGAMIAITGMYAVTIAVITIYLTYQGV